MQPNENKKELRGRKRSSFSLCTFASSTSMSRLSCQYKYWPIYSMLTLFEIEFALQFPFLIHLTNKWMNFEWCVKSLSLKINKMLCYLKNHTKCLLKKNNGKIIGIQKKIKTKTVKNNCENLSINTFFFDGSDVSSVTVTNDVQNWIVFVDIERSVSTGSIRSFRLFSLNSGTLLIAMLTFAAKSRNRTTYANADSNQAVNISMRWFAGVVDVCSLCVCECVFFQCVRKCILWWGRVYDSLSAFHSSECSTHKHTHTQTHAHSYSHSCKRMQHIKCVFLFHFFYPHFFFFSFHSSAHDIRIYAHKHRQKLVVATFMRIVRIAWFCGIFHFHFHCGTLTGGFRFQQQNWWQFLYIFNYAT